MLVENDDSEGHSVQPEEPVGSVHKRLSKLRRIENIDEIGIAISGSWTNWASWCSRKSMR